MKYETKKNLTREESRLLHWLDVARIDYLNATPGTTEELSALSEIHKLMEEAKQKGIIYEKK